MWSLLELFPEVSGFNVLDIGAALGEKPAYQPLLDAKRVRITGFEPDPRECERLVREYGPPHRFFPYFIGDGGPAVFHETNWALTGSLYEPNSPLLEKFNNLAEVTQEVATHPVRTTRVDDIAELGDVDLVKIDIQGGELGVFQNAVRTLSGVLLIQTEVEFLELYRGQPMFADVDIFLRGQGFQFHTLENVGRRAFKPLIVNGDVNAGIRQYVWADAVYVRDWLRLDGLDDLKLRKYAILAHDVLQSYDLALTLLLALDQRSGKKDAAAYMDRLSGSPLPSKQA
jgi:protein O-GlcNAc transferase